MKKASLIMKNASLIYDSLSDLWKPLWFMEKALCHLFLKREAFRKCVVAVSDRATTSLNPRCKPAHINLQILINVDQPSALRKVRKRRYLNGRYPASQSIMQENLKSAIRDFLFEKIATYPPIFRNALCLQKKKNKKKNGVE